MNEVETSLRKMVHCFEQLKIPYVVMGGLAVRIHALPRPTHDVDFTIKIAREKLDEWFSAVEKLGYTVPDQYRNGWVKSVAGMPIVKVRNYLADGMGVDVDVFLAESDFQTNVISRGVTVSIDQFSMNVVTPEDLILLKLIANRPAI